MTRSRSPRGLPPEVSAVEKAGAFWKLPRPLWLRQLNTAVVRFFQSPLCAALLPNPHGEMPRGFTSRGLYSGAGASLIVRPLWRIIAAIDRSSFYCSCRNKTYRLPQPAHHSASSKLGFVRIKRLVLRSAGEEQETAKAKLCFCKNNKRTIDR